jgi:radical SAM protein with 4Fe4S-binding SPASM domain
VWKIPRINYPKGELSTKYFKNIILRLKKETKFKVAAFSGGEPLLRNDIFDLVKFADENKIKSTLITNGTLLSEKVVDKCIDAGVALFEISLLSPRNKIHDKLVRAEAHNKVLDGFANVKSAGGNSIAAFVATKMNIAETKETAELAVALGAKGMMFNRFNPGGEGTKHVRELLPSLNSLVNALKQLDLIGEQYGISVSSNVPIPPCLLDTKEFKHVKFGYCPAGEKNAYFTIDPLGNVRTCNHSPTILGNLKTHSFAEVKNHPFVKELKERLPSLCLACTQRNLCKGNCKASAEVCYGSLVDPEPLLKQNLNLVHPLHY